MEEGKVEKEKEWANEVFDVVYNSDFTRLKDFDKMQLEYAIVVCGTFVNNSKYGADYYRTYHKEGHKELLKRCEQNLKRHSVFLSAINALLEQKEQ